MVAAAPHHPGTSKQLLPVFDKPMIYYPLSTLMLAGIRDVLVITTAFGAAGFGRLLGDVTGSESRSLAQAFVIGRDHIGAGAVALVLGDNIFYGPSLGSQLGRFSDIDGGTILAYRVADPSAYGVVEFDEHLRAISLQEKPKSPRSDTRFPVVLLRQRCRRYRG